MSERQLTVKVLAYLKGKGIFCFKIAGGPRQRAGIADILAVLPGGRFFAIELKAPNKEAKPSDLQAVFLDKVNAAGGYGVCVNSLEEVMEIVEFEGRYRCAVTL